MWQNIPLWPTGASTISHSVDGLYIYLVVVCGGITLLIFLTIAFFLWRYRAKVHPVAQPIAGSLPIEIVWSAIPFVIFLTFFVWGASIYFAEARPPANATEVYVVAKQWMWKVQHQNGVREINTLHVPVDRDVRLTMISQDVIHSFFVPAFRIKQDVLPGRYTTTWFRAIKPGHYHLFCAEYCGTEHSGMIGEVIVMEPADYQAWLSEGGAQGSLSATGQKLFLELGCSTCHRSDAQGRGPSLQGVSGRTVLLDDGRKVVADDNYLRESILQPNAKIVAGYQPIMPTFQGIVSEDQLLSLIAYVKSLSPPAPADGGPPPADNGAPAAP